MKKIFGVLMVALMFSGCARNVADVKKMSAQCADQAGYSVLGYEGYENRPILGGIVWYTLTRKQDNGITYEAGFVKWNNECHIYDLKAIDAIKS